MVQESVAVAKDRFEVLQKQIANLERKRDAAKSRSQRLKTEYQRIQKTGAKPVTEILRTDAVWVISAAAICGSGVGFIIGHSVLSTAGGIVGVPIGGITLFALVSRFVYNGTLYDGTTTRFKGREAIAEAKAQDEEVLKLKELLPLALERLNEAELLADAERTRLARIQEERVAHEEQVAAQELRVIPAREETLIDVPWEEKPPTENQVRFARKLGVRLVGNESRGDLSSMIDLAIAERNTMMQQPIVVQNHIHQQQHSSSKAAAVFFSIIWPGIGQIYQGRIFSGLFFIFATPIGYLCLIVPGLILHLICIIDSALYRAR